MGVPVVYRTSSASKVANFQFVDIATGVGYLDAYGVEVNNGNEYVLTTSVFNSDDIILGSGTQALTTTPQKVLDIDFDLLFKTGRQLVGELICNVPLSVSDGTGSGVSNGYVHIRVRKWDGSTETEIADGRSQTRGATSGGIVSHIHSLSITIPQTSLKAGEYLRITVEGWGACPSSTTDGELILGMDPANRAEGTYFITTGHTDTQMKFSIPMRVNL